jgi:hypothetical protein
LADSQLAVLVGSWVANVSVSNTCDRLQRDLHVATDAHLTADEQLQAAQASQKALLREVGTLRQQLDKYRSVERLELCGGGLVAALQERVSALRSRNSFYTAHLGGTRARGLGRGGGTDVGRR